MFRVHRARSSVRRPQVPERLRKSFGVAMIDPTHATQRSGLLKRLTSR
jgi:hypothetical protein